MSLQETKLREIADAIREQERSSGDIPAKDFASRVRALKIGEDVDVTLLTTEIDKLTGVYESSFTWDRVLANNTPAQISAVSARIAQDGLTSQQVFETYGWSLGDEIPITLTSGETIEMQIIGFNHDNKSDGSGKAGITLQMVECLATSYPMNSSSTNAGGYAASKMKTETLPTLKALLPQEWQDVIKLVDKKSANGGSSNYSETLTTSDDLFLLAGIELFGSEGSYDYAQDGANEGAQYEYWTGKAAADRIKKYDKDADGVPETATAWWLRSSYYKYTNYFCIGGTYGNANSSNAIYSLGVAFGFCV